jgi:ankyrin repeat protein
MDTKEKEEEQQHDASKLYVACTKGDLQEVRELLDKGANINASDKVFSLVIASRSGHTEVVKLLLERGADIEAKNSFGYTAFDLAGMEGHKEIALLLFEAEAEQYRDILKPPQMLKTKEQTQDNKPRPGR